MFDESGGGGPVMQAETESLHLAAVRCSNTADTLNGLVNNLMQRLEGMKDDLVGLTGSAFQNTKEALHPQMLALNNALDEIGGKVGIAEVGYAAGDEEAQGIVAAVNADGTDIERALRA